jgi:hypothetical protein
MPTSATAGSIASFLAIVIHEFLRINLGHGVGQGCRTTFNAGLLMPRNGMPRENLMHSCVDDHNGISTRRMRPGRRRCNFLPSGVFLF